MGLPNCYGVPFQYDCGNGMETGDAGPFLESQGLPSFESPGDGGINQVGLSAQNCSSLASALMHQNCDDPTGFQSNDFDLQAAFPRRKQQNRKNMKLKATQFRGFNEDLLNPKQANPVQLGASGVSSMRGFSADYNRPSKQRPLQGAGVSSMAQAPKAGVITPESYSLYNKGGYAQKGEGLYGGKSDPRNLKMYR